MEMRKWLIKKLGGYTQYEYDLRPVAKFKVHNENIEKIRVCTSIRDSMVLASDDMVLLQKLAKEELKRRISDRLDDDGFLTYKTHREESGYIVECDLYAVRGPEW